MAKFQNEVRKTPQGDVGAWSAKLTKVVATADATNVLNATGMPTLALMHAALNGHVPDAATMRAALATSGKGAAAPEVIGSRIADTTYTPLPNGRCRIANSALITSPLPANVTRLIDVEDIASYASQGGNGTLANGDGSANCGIPSFATAFVVNISVSGGAANGNVKLFAGAASPGGGSITLFKAGDLASSSLIVPSCQACFRELAINSTTQLNYVLDIIGYFMPSQATALQCVETGQTSKNVASGSTADVEAPACAAGYTMTATNCQSTSWDTSFVYMRNGTCSAKNNGAIAAAILASRQCCRVPGR